MIFFIEEEDLGDSDIDQSSSSESEESNDDAAEKEILLEEKQTRKVNPFFF